MRKPIEPFGLYLIITDPRVGPVALAELAVRQRVAFLQLRLKGKPRSEIVAVARAVAQITKGTETRFVVNDDVRIAAEVEADGVHLGQDDMPLSEARRLWSAPHKVFGLSTHNAEQASLAVSVAPDYIGVGPVYPTPTKAVPAPVLGLPRLRQIVAASPLLPAVAIGGITVANLPHVLEAGAVNFAVVREVNCSDHPGEVIARLLDIWRARVGARSPAR